MLTLAFKKMSDFFLQKRVQTLFLCTVKATHCLRTMFYSGFCSSWKHFLPFFNMSRMSCYSCQVIGAVRQWERNNSCCLVYLWRLPLSRGHDVTQSLDACAPDRSISAPTDTQSHAIDHWPCTFLYTCHSSRDSLTDWQFGQNDVKQMVSRHSYKVNCRLKTYFLKHTKLRMKVISTITQKSLDDSLVPFYPSLTT